MFQKKKKTISQCLRICYYNTYGRIPSSPSVCLPIITQLIGSDVPTEIQNYSLSVYYCPRTKIIVPRGSRRCWYVCTRKTSKIYIHVLLHLSRGNEQTHNKGLFGCVSRTQRRSNRTTRAEYGDGKNDADLILTDLTRVSTWKNHPSHDVFLAVVNNVNTHVAKKNRLAQ